MPSCPARRRFPCSLSSAGLIACALVLLPSLAFAQQIWVESFTGMSGSEKPNGYRYNVGVFGDPIQVFFNYTRISATAGVDAFVNGVSAGFSCTFTDVAPDTGSGSCFAFVPYTCGKTKVAVRRGDTISNPPTIFESQPVDVFVYDNPQCLPQCDSCQLTTMGQAPGRPVNVAAADQKIDGNGCRVVCRRSCWRHPHPYLRSRPC